MLLLSILVVNKILTQKISMGYGPIFTHTTQKVRMKNSQDDFMNTAYQFCLSFEHPLRKKGLSAKVSYSEYKGYTWMKFREGEYLGSDGQWTLGNGFSGINNNRIDLVVSFNILNKKDKIFLKPNVGLGLQISKDNGWDFYAEAEKIDGPVYFETQPIYVLKHSITQIVPTAGFSLGTVFFKRIELSLTCQGIYGFRSFQDMYFEYTYYDEPQETAIFQGKGTGLYTSINIGYRIIKLKDKK